MSRLAATTKLDIVVQMRSKLFAIAIGMAVTLGLAMRFLLPHEMIPSLLPLFYLFAIGGTAYLFVAGMVIFEKGEHTLDVQIISPLQIILVAAVAGLFAPSIMMFIGTVASNKVEGFAMIKILGIVSLIPIGAWFIPMPWQLIAGIYPPFWVSKAIWTIAEGGSLWPFYLLAGVITSAIFIRLMTRRFQDVAYL